MCKPNSAMQSSQGSSKGADTIIELVLALLCLCVGLREPGGPALLKTYHSRF